jgi:AraC family transcriptional regulator of adaptative response/methylated-DNA-[protein]-cysteine methyltransferase
MIRFGLGPTPLGFAFVALTDRGVGGLYFLDDEDPSPALARLRKDHPAVALVEDGAAVAPILRRIDAWLDGEPGGDDVRLDVRGTAFQRRVWDALRSIPAGSTRTYGELARLLGKPGAARAVGSACAKNPVALFVPCHRVVHHNGDPGGYHWGLERKRALLERERLRMISR